MPVRSWCAVLVGWLIVGAGLAAAAEVPGNRIANGEFDGATLDPWTEANPSISEFQVDTLFEANDCASSDAARGINTNDADFGATRYEICTTDVAAGEELAAFARVLFPVGTSDSRVSLAVYAYSETDCDTGLLDSEGGDFAFATDGLGVWYDIDLFAPLTLPEGTQSVELGVIFVKISGDDPVADLVFDAVHLVPTDFVFADGFEIGDSCRWSAAVD